MYNPWYVYLLRCSDSSFYCGIAKDVHKRLYAHSRTKRGAKYTRSRLPVTLAWVKECEGRSGALKMEREIKKLSHKQKETLCACNNLALVQGEGHA